MITFSENNFHLQTRDTSYILRIGQNGHLEQVYYGPILAEQDFSPLYTKLTAGIGTTVAYDGTDPHYSLDRLTLEYSGTGKGDYRHSPSEIKMPDGTWVTDFQYKDHRIYDQGAIENPAQSTDTTPSLPWSIADPEHSLTLEITLTDPVHPVDLLLFYRVFPETNVFTRRARLVNRDPRPVVIRKLMSFMVDFPESDFDFITFDGGWSKEAHKHIRPLSYGLYVNESTTGASSNRHNPGFILAKKHTQQDGGLCYGFNLIYSGNHYGAVEISNHNLTRVMGGINPHCFEWRLDQNQGFDTPEAVLSCSADGFNGLSRNMHLFVQNHIVRGEFKSADRPVLMNSWEAHFFDFNRKKLLNLAKQGKKLGIELFVLDDGWFSTRNDDTSGLGDYWVNRKKLPGGLESLGKKINKLGMEFGLWFEPEMVNPNSDLFKKRPDWAVQIPGRNPALGRNQLVLDLCNPEVREYIVENVNTILASAPITYVKWDMNRHISDMYSPTLGSERQGEFFHRYILGLYEILDRITGTNPKVLFESCASGGNRYDLGMLCSMPQVWASDDTDPVERLKIQEGLSYLYPPSTMGAHVSLAPHQQTLRTTPLATRFNVAAFGLLGYELDLKEVSPVERREIKKHIAFYKENRRTFQFGQFTRFNPESDPGNPEQKSNKITWQVTSPDRKKALVGIFQTLAQASPPSEVLRVPNLIPDLKYHFQTFAQSVSLRTFGGLIKHALPVHFKTDGFIMRLVNRFYQLPNAVENYLAGGDMLAAGIRLKQQFMGSNYNPQTRLLGDFGSNIFSVQAVGTNTKNSASSHQDKKDGTADSPRSNHPISTNPRKNEETIQ